MNQRFIIRFIAASFVMGAVVANAQDHPQGSQILVPFKQNLQAALKSGLENGVIQAISACNILAPDIANSASQDGIRVGRTSHRLRNPENVAPDWVKPYLTAFVDGSATPKAITVTINDTRTGYLEPIRLKPLCVSCHGVDIDKNVERKIKSLYTEDRAVGFKVGDLRGLFWAEYPTNQ